MRFWPRSFFHIDLRPEYHEAKALINSLDTVQLHRIKTIILSMVKKCFYSKSKSNFEFNVYMLAQNEDELNNLNTLDDNSWREIIVEMIASGHEILKLAEGDSPMNGDIALINITALRRASFRIIKNL